MPSTSLMDAVIQLAEAVDKGTDIVAHEEIARIVKLHAKLAIGAAWIPVPIADFAAMTANTWAMYVRINKTLGIPFSDTLIKSLASGIATNLLSNLPILAVGEVLKAIPGVGTITGGVALSATLYAVTIAAGIVYMRALAFLLKEEPALRSELTEVKLAELKAKAEQVFSDKEAMKKLVKEGKEVYAAAKASGELEKTPGGTG